MAKFIIKRVLWMIPVLLGVTLIVFALTRMSPGDPVYAVLGSNITPEQYEAKRIEMGLDRSFLRQFVDYVWGIVTRFDLGTSYQTGRNVGTEVLERFPITLKLGLIGVAITVVVGIPLGIVAAVKQNSIFDYLVTIISMFFASMPNFWMALMMILIFSVNLGILPATGLDHWYSWILPAAALGLSPVASVTRMTRSSMLEVIRQDYIRTARAKGLKEMTIIRHHELKNALINVITVVGMQMSMIMAGSVVVESIFAIPGLGTYMMSAINNENYPAVQGCVIIIAFAVCVMNLIVDLVYGFVDPRIMAEYTGGKKRNKRKKASESDAPKEAA